MTLLGNKCLHENTGENKLAPKAEETHTEE